MVIKKTRLKPAKTPDNSGQDQGELQRCGTTLICCEESNGERMEGEYKII